MTALEVTCPRCKALPGVPCRRDDGAVMDVLHVARTEEARLADVPSVCHVAGLDITWADRYQRQRCAWCGATLIDIDLATIATDDGSPPPFWQAGSLVRVQGHMTYAVEGRTVVESEESIDHPGPMPDDSCMRIDPAITV